MNDNEKKDVAITATNVSSVDDVGHVSDVNQSTLHFILLRPQNYLPAVLILGVAFFFGVFRGKSGAGVISAEIIIAV